MTAALILGLLIPLVPPATAGEAEFGEPAAAASDAEFDGECVMGLALGKDIKTDCSVSTVYDGKNYCFGNETARTLFLKKPDEFLLQAHVYYSSKQPAQSDSNNQSKPGRAPTRPDAGDYSFGRPGQGLLGLMIRVMSCIIAHEPGISAPEFSITTIVIRSDGR